MVQTAIKHEQNKKDLFPVVIPTNYEEKVKAIKAVKQLKSKTKLEPQ